jgi:hypothetical protein
MTSAELLPAAVLNRKAVVYIRQSTQIRHRSRPISRASGGNTSLSMSRGNGASATSR